MGAPPLLRAAIDDRPLSTAQALLRAVVARLLGRSSR